MWGFSDKVICFKFLESWILGPGPWVWAWALPYDRNLNKKHILLNSTCSM